MKVWAAFVADVEYDYDLASGYLRLFCYPTEKVARKLCPTLRSLHSMLLRVDLNDVRKGGGIFNVQNGLRGFGTQSKVYQKHKAWSHKFDLEYIRQQRLSFKERNK